MTSPHPSPHDTQIAVLAWLHAELAYQHQQLVDQLQAMIQQLTGPAGMNPAQAQAIRARAARIQRIRNAAQVKAVR